MADKACEESPRPSEHPGLGEISRACEQAAKTTVLTDRKAIDTETLLGALEERRSGKLASGR